jgi:hypothetical protein
MISALKKINRKQLLLGVAVIAIIGAIVVLSARATGAFFSIEPENSTIVSPVTSISDATASGGKYVQFGP